MSADKIGKVRRIDEDSFLFLMGLLMLLSEILKQYTLIKAASGEYPWWYFPFQLCSVPMYLCVLLPCIRHRFSENLCSNIYAFLASFGLLGGVMAFFDTSGMHFTAEWLTVHSYAWHILLILIGIFAGRRCTRNDWNGALVIYLISVIIATFLNVSFHDKSEINMFYISPYYGTSQVVFGRIEEQAGRIIRIIIYLLASVIGARLFFLFSMGLWNHIDIRKE